MIKWVILGIIIYLILGFITCLLIQMHDSKISSFEEKWLFFGIDNSTEIFSVILVWWLFWVLGFFGILIPNIINALYKLFILIVFGIGALFKTNA